MTNSELAARELQARINLKANGLDRPEPNYTDGLDHSEY